MIMSKRKSELRQDDRTWHNLDIPIRQEDFKQVNGASLCYFLLLSVGDPCVA